MLHEEPDEFERDGARITKCPACRRGRPRLGTADRQHLALAGELALLCGDDVEAGQFGANYELVNNLHRWFDRVQERGRTLLAK
ncbi:MAG: hypothetical protein D6685_03060, partial [Bacteroidetes bacterium]